MSLYYFMYSQLCYSGSFLLTRKSFFSPEQLSYFVLVSTPFTFKIGWAPLVDNVHIAWLGRRKGVIVLAMLCNSALMLSYANSVDHMVENQVVFNQSFLAIFCFSLVSNFLLSILDIAIDGLGVSIFDESNKSNSGYAKTLGMITGSIVGTTLFVSANNPLFCKKYVYGAMGIKWSRPILTNAAFLYLQVAFSLTLVLLLVCFYDEEANSPEEELQRPIGVQASFQYVGNLLLQPEFQLLTVVILVLRVGYVSTVDTIIGYKMLDHGFPNYLMVLADVINIPFNFYASKLASRVKLDHIRTMHSWIHLWTLKNAFWVAFSLYAMKHADLESAPFLVFYYSFNVLVSFLVVYTWTIITSFFYSIADPKIGGLYMTLLASIINGVNECISFVGLRLDAHLTKALSSYSVIVVYIVFVVIYYSFNYRFQERILNIDKLDKHKSFWYRSHQDTHNLEINFNYDKQSDVDYGSDFENQSLKKSFDEIQEMHQQLKHTFD